MLSIQAVDELGIQSNLEKGRRRISEEELCRAEQNLHPPQLCSPGSVPTHQGSRTLWSITRWETQVWASIKASVLQSTMHGFKEPTQTKHLTFPQTNKISSCQSCSVVCIVTVMDVFLICGVLNMLWKPCFGHCSCRDMQLKKFLQLVSEMLCQTQAWITCFQMRASALISRLFPHLSETPPRPQTILHPTKHPVIELKKLPTAPESRLQRNRSLTLNPSLILAMHMFPPFIKKKWAIPFSNMH